MHFFWDSTCPISPQQICRWIFSWDPDKPKFPPIRSWNNTLPEIDIPNFPQTDLGIHFRRKPDMFHFPPNRSGTALFLRFGHAPFPPKQIWKSPFLGFGHLEFPPNSSWCDLLFVTCSSDMMFDVWCLMFDVWCLMFDGHGCPQQPRHMSILTYDPAEGSPTRQATPTNHQTDKTSVCSSWFDIQVVHEVECAILAQNSTWHCTSTNRTCNTLIMFMEQDVFFSPSNRTWISIMNLDLHNWTYKIWVKQIFFFPHKPNMESDTTSDVKSDIKSDIKNRTIHRFQCPISHLTCPNQSYLLSDLMSDLMSNFLKFVWKMGWAGSNQFFY